MDTLLKDLAFALRSLLRNPGFAAAAVLTLALGIGANTAIFSVVHGVLLRPLPYPDPQQIFVLWNNNTREGIERDVTSFPNFLDWRERNDVFAAMAGYANPSVTLTDRGEPEQVRASQVTADFFDVVGVRPAIGRAFAESEMEPGNTDVVLLGHAIWQGRFGGDDVIGRTISVNGVPLTVVGVMPAGFDYPAEAQLWLPLAPTGGAAEARGALWLSVIGRLRADVTPALAQSRMSAVAAQLADEYPAPNTGADIMLEPLHATITGDVRTPLLVLLGAVGLVLLIGCANVANLLLARGAVRRKELAIRAALGAGRRRVARQLLTESVTLALVGGVAGTLIGIWAVTAILAVAPAELPRLDSVRMDPIVLGFALLTSLVAGLLFGLAPLLQAGRADVMTTLREGGREAVGAEGVGRLRPVLVSAEVALALVLLIGAGLLIRSFAALNSVEPGFSTRDAVTFRVVLPGARYTSSDHSRSFYAQFDERLATIPGVTAVGGVSTLFLQRLPNMAPITMQGAPPVDPDAPQESVVYDAVTPGFFDALGMRIVSGRGTRASDDPTGTPVAVVNEAFVRRYSPDRDPIGRRFTPGSGQSEDTQWIEIVGVVSDARRSGLAVPARPESYRPHTQNTTAGLTFVVRSTQSPDAVVRAVRGMLADLDPLLPLSAVSTLEASLAESLAARRFTMMLLVSFAALAAVLAAIGIYGVISYLVMQRTRELGVRLALGATRSDVQRLVVGQSLRHVVPGIVVGTAAALALSRVMASQLFGVRPTDPLTFAGVALLLLTVALVASYVPAWRASRLDPAITLRQD
jgi:putative ABC transport system permease protein